MGELRVKQLTGNIGAEIGGIQIADEHSDDTIAEIRAALLAHLGGDTLWADMALAFDMLPDDIKEQIEGLEAVHDFTKAFGRGQTEEVKERMREENPSVTHPVVRTHPETGRKTLYVNRSF